MRRAILLVAVVVLGLAAAVPGVGAITFGEPDNNRHPNVGILAAQLLNGEWVYGCTGTLIAPHVLVTAGHCFDGLDVPDAYVSFAEDPEGDYPPDWGGDLFHGTYYVPDGLWHDHADPHDVAVLVLDAEPGLPLATLPTENLLGELKPSLRGQTFTVVGYGAVRDSQAGGMTYYQDPARRFATETYLSLQPSWLTASMNPATGNGGTCYGDSGGPHFLGDSSLLLAVTVTGDMPCKAMDQAYRLDTPSAREFLGQFVVLP